ncbi:hypothetical protein LZC95_50875 [Pendulispora brunnea]|uniref:Tetratricopeptide repeat protein n=1 Tax=Pendulispora brunnea TaxID=2905690 RepID=A0ABZ2K7Q0_9BACT
MRTIDEERWIAIVAAEARGERIGRHDAEFRRGYEAARAPDAEEAAFWADLGRLGAACAGTAEMTDAAMAQRILAMNDEVRPVPRWSRATVRRTVATLLAAVAIAATLVVLAAEMMHRREATPMPPVENAAPVAHPPSAPPARKPMSSAAPELVPEPVPELLPPPAASHREAMRLQPAKPELHSERSAEALLSDAQMFVAAGRTDEAMAAYRILIERYPHSVEARASRVSLGRLSLAHNEAAAALAEFDRYLDGGGGPLEAEARYGRIRALQSLSREADERAAIVDFLARHADSVHAAPLRARLSALTPNP